jgi:hypothetical protein
MSKATLSHPHVIQGDQGTDMKIMNIIMGDSNELTVLPNCFAFKMALSSCQWDDFQKT